MKVPIVCVILYYRLGSVLSIQEARQICNDIAPGCLFVGYHWNPIQNVARSHVTPHGFYL
jgi:hypothetical protein